MMAPRKIGVTVRSVPERRQSSLRHVRATFWTRARVRPKFDPVRFAFRADWCALEVGGCVPGHDIVEFLAVQAGDGGGHADHACVFATADLGGVRAGGALEFKPLAHLQFARERPRENGWE
jgi:hypothetical protein